MPGTTTNNAFRYPTGGDAPDGPGGIFNLASDVDALLGSGTWAPTLGGTAATVGANSASGGSWSRVGKHVSAKGRITFGSSASFGTGTPVIGGLPVTIVPQYSNGYGLLIPTSGSPVVVMLRGIDGANLELRVVRSQAAGALADAPLATAYGAPGQSAELHFTLDLTTT